MLKYIGVLLIVVSIAPGAQAADPLLKDRIFNESEKPDRSYYGTSTGGLLVESMELRQRSARALQAGDFDEAINTARKAVQFDSGNTDSHLALAKALTGKIYKLDFDVSPLLIDEATHEWKRLRWKSADGLWDDSAGKELMKLKFARVGANHRKKMREKEVDAIVLGKAPKTK